MAYTLCTKFGRQNDSYKKQQLPQFKYNKYFYQSNLILFAYIYAKILSKIDKLNSKSVKSNVYETTVNDNFS